MTPDLAALRIARQLQAVEDGIDQLIGEASTLLATLATARIETASPASTGHLAMARITGLQQKLMEGRRDAMKAHGELRKIAVERGDIPTECPDNAMGSLAAVA